MVADWYTKTYLITDDSSDAIDYVNPETKNSTVLSTLERELATEIDLADDKMKVQAGKLQRIAEDAPKRLEEWPVVIFRVPTRAAKAPVTPLLLPPSTA